MPVLLFDEDQLYSLSYVWVRVSPEGEGGFHAALCLSMHGSSPGSGDRAPIRLFKTFIQGLSSPVSLAGPAFHRTSGEQGRVAAAAGLSLTSACIECAIELFGGKGEGKVS